MVRFLLVVFVACLPAAGQEYWHRVTGTLGFLSPHKGQQTADFNTPPLVSVDYGFRFNRHGQWDTGIDIAFAKRGLGAGGEQRHNIYIPRVGYRVVVPFLADRAEAYAGFGGAHSFFKPNLAGRQSWLVYGQLGGNYAIDEEGRYRAGMMVRWYRDPIGRPVQQWIGVGAEISYHWHK
jgi:hypothetical protein